MDSPYNDETWAAAKDRKVAPPGEGINFPPPGESVDLRAIAEQHAQSPAQDNILISPEAVELVRAANLRGRPDASRRFFI